MQIVFFVEIVGLERSAGSSVEFKRKYAKC